MTSPVLAPGTSRAISSAKSIILRTCVLVECFCSGTLQAYDVASLLGVTEPGAKHLTCSRTKRITMLTALVEKAGNVSPKMESDAIGLACSIRCH